ncbi:dentin sialophosphoprotein-like [Dorcoceras hygrometricum]|uniref:Dentin sialophosphoprotein-like n=1 Tax=Dorcoceras hygrometricum TaxID=472368 RepID=A0A2Z7AV29_9LAMI|nr:dentin sialophosphoprotein-like [Dorcoceras hygrometricum]
MNCTRYVRSCYESRDLSKCESGFSSHPFVFDGENEEEQGNVISLLPINMDQHLGYDKVLLSQIMQKHEVTFRHQLQELHRLYRRQRELMDDIKVREMFARHIQFPASQSNNCLSQTRSEVSQTSHTTSWILGDRLDNKLSVVSTHNRRGPSDFVVEDFQEPTTANPGLLLARNCYNRVKAPSFISKGHEMRILNLRFPEPVYHDAEEMERFDEVKVSKDPKRESAHSPFKTRDTTSFDARCRNKKNLIDLNEPIQLESVASNSTSPLEPFQRCLEFSHHDTHASGEVETGSVPKQCRYDSYGRESVDRNSSVGFDLNSMPLSCSSEAVITQVDLPNSNQEYKIEDPKEHLLSFVEKPDYSSGFPCSFKSKLSQASGGDKSVILSTNSVHHHEMSKEKCVTVDPDPRIREKLMEFETHIDLNVGAIADETLPSLSSNNVGTKSTGVTDLEAPLSPENKEGFPPRGKSRDMLLGTPSILAEHGEAEPEVKPNGPDGIAAETLLLMSSAKLQDFNLSNSLYWLAEIATTTDNTEDQENKVMELQNGSTNKDGCMLLSDKIEEFKDTTGLSQKKALNLSRDVNKEKEGVSLSCRSVRSRATKDHHTAKPFQKTCSSKRNVGKNSSERPKSHSRSCPLNAKKPVASILKEPATRGKAGVLQSWGKIRKRQGGPRRCASKFLTIS